MQHQQQQKYPQEEQQQQQQQQQQMGFNGDGGGGGGGGGGGNNNRGGGGGGLTRFWSAPSTWLDSLVQDLGIPPSQNHCLPQLPSSTTTPPPPPPPSPLQRSSNFFDTTTSSGAGTLLSTSSDLGFLRQNSSPAELLDNLTSSQGLGSDGYLPSFGGDFNYNLSSSSSSPLDFPSNNNNKRTRESEFHQDPSKFSPQLKGEPLSGVNSFSDMEMEKLFEDSVPCRVRAKRGCATHPRSIAERVRRTRISDRIRKLQELVPNMDKQTNTADMLEEAVEYVKVLQKQIKELSEHQQNCTCLARS